MRKWLLVGVLALILQSPVKAQAPADIVCAPPGSTQPVSCRTLGLGNAGYPPGSTPAGSSQTATTGGITISIGPTAGQFSYLCGIGASPGAATAAINLTISITNSSQITGGWTVAAPVAAAGTTGVDFNKNFGPYCIRSQTVNQALSVSIGALGAGGVGQALSIWGYTQ